MSTLYRTDRYPMDILHLDEIYHRVWCWPGRYQTNAACQSPAHQYTMPSIFHPWTATGTMQSCQRVDQAQRVFLFDWYISTIDFSCCNDPTCLCRDLKGERESRDILSIYHHPGDRLCKRNGKWRCWLEIKCSWSGHPKSDNAQYPSYWHSKVFMVTLTFPEREDSLEYGNSETRRINNRTEKPRQLAILTDKRIIYYLLVFYSNTNLPIHSDNKIARYYTQPATLFCCSP